ncbi:hypothetical protein EJ08DRAFT_729989 [Tothia fuscella]|uniref:EF-hand domain-containing protein n=1 Tax=Tothia fuscella TaxID=1048955 RepID=A0A9P4NZR1_9PEZI|nr:hypothetical protein EJ08DRAFT_729989 [Tothia fuscella]
MSTPPNNLKPAPLSFNSARASPFRRPESPLGRSPSTLRAPTPQSSPLKQSTPGPSALQLSASASQSSLRALSPAATEDRSWLTTRGTSAPPAAPTSPTRLSNSDMNNFGNSLAPAKPNFDSPTSQTTPTASRQTYSRTTSSATARPLPTLKNIKSNNDPFSGTPPHHLHTMRESFAVLDRNNTGSINPADVAQQLSELGLDSSSTALSSYFPPSNPQNINLASYLSLLSSDLANLSRQEELMAAFSAFDEDDSGQIDVGELREAVLSTMPEPGSGDRQLSEREVDRVMEGFVGRRAFKRGGVGNSSGLGGNKKDVFRYGDFVAGIWGGNGETQKVDV